MERREWFQLMAALAAAPEIPAQQNPAAQPQRISKETLTGALKTMGLEFSEEHLALMLPRVNRGLGSLEALRKIDIPLDTEPAITYSTRLPGQSWPRTARFQPTRSVARRDWKNVEDLAFWPVTELAPLVKAKRITSAALTKMYLERLKQFSPKLNCVITLTEELALEQAARADAEIRRGRYKGPLHGIPYGVKDLFATKGIPTTWGAEPYQKQVFDYNCTVVERLEKAGGVLLAKLSMGALAMGGLWFGGMTKTPWNIEQTSSGSSAGSASATAAGCVGFSIGTETLGSIVTPSTRCGVVGLRPTYGRVSRFGAMALSWTMDKIGPICRGVEDCALVLRAIYGPDGRDGTVPDAPLGWEPRKPLANLRVGILQKDFDSVRDDDKKVYEQTLEDLRKTGATLKSVELPQVETGALLVILNAEAGAAFDDLTRDGGVNQLKDQAANAWPNSFRTSRLIPAVEYIRAQRARTLLLRKMEEFLKDWDVLVSPTSSGPILTITNLTGHPQVVVPCGFTGGMPRGLLFTSRLCQEGDAMRVALAYEQATKWHTMRPPLQ
ncbi:MAG: amidase [Candidatus Solibacter usitatus]|nr:amidase [Candidatus Solibacter usitatus]